MQRGFITIATGDERYYQMARTLLRSYRQNCCDPMPFAVIADRENEYTAEFDDVIILENPTNSWMDKLELLRYCPYDENIFIDADCIVYRDINFFWTLFSYAGDFSCFGAALPMDASWGWFSNQAADVYPIHFITHLHGISYFVRRGDTLRQFDELCQDIMRNYHRVQFRDFNDEMADESIFALAMAVMNLKPVNALPEYYGFVPSTTKLYVDYLSRSASYCTPWHGYVENGCIIHWGNQNTKKALYREERHKINYLFRAESGVAVKIYMWFFYRTRLLSLLYWIQDVLNHCVWLARRVWNKVLKKLKG